MESFVWRISSSERELCDQEFPKTVGGSHCRDIDSYEILDPPLPARELSGFELMSIWDGKGLLLSEEQLSVDASVSSLRFHRLLRFSLWSGVLCLLGALMWRGIHLVAKTKLVDTLMPLQVPPSVLTLLLLVVAVAAGLCAGMSPGGSLNRHESIRLIQGRFFPKAFPDVTFDEVKSAIEKYEAVIIDTRDEEDFSSGHIPTSGSVPVHRPVHVKKAMMRDTDFRKRVVLYCSSRDCGNADVGAQELELFAVFQSQ